ncbi:cyclodeaminase/cyclohydrolase family protein [Deinococcus radiophilus]|uniref:Cyclodeaminase/cyclohydrolase domain-containing protein n=1 Tax=Deinococcus radiophilus TaxID=32062 RepID=A0A431VQA3_9DEIO|nr:cyclodeaminase/cyclohydrolase family protein [Deinococcus radiophilus]RTR25397.1 hypothetical protein EJ104_10925 [Deinococcus radiophilus]UFA50031.1 cyclodeaminase/cyclohydrolase family protein [Deinococcus radiophilus]
MTSDAKNTLPTLWTHTAQELLDAAGSRRATPTGGSVTAISGVFGLALLTLAVNLTLSKKDPPAELTDHLDTLRSFQSRLQALADEDASLYADFMKQARQNDGGPDDKLRRQTREVPLQLARELAQALALTTDLRPLVHRSVISDIDAGAALLQGALQAALITLASNLGSSDQDQNDTDSQTAELWTAWQELQDQRQQALAQLSEYQEAERSDRQ